MKKPFSKKSLQIKELAQKTQPCPQCGYLIGNIAGSKKAICQNCGFKDPCCD